MPAELTAAVPELGPSLGRLGEPPTGAHRGPLGLTLEDLRLALVTEVFELAGAARSFAAAGDRQDALASLGRVAWLAAWERAVGAAAARLTDVVNARFREAAAESRLPDRRLQQLLLTPDDTRAIAARLSSGGAGFVAALDTLEATVPAASAPGARGQAGWNAWRNAVSAAARRLESAWLALESAADAEQARWHAEIERVRAWRRSTWPLWLLTALVLAAAIYVGLVLGGYLPVPSPLRPLTELWWTHLWT